MNTILHHPTHGTKIAICDQEIEYDEQNGWSRYNSDAVSTVDETVPVNTLITKRKYSKRTIEES